MCATVRIKRRTHVCFIILYGQQMCEHLVDMALVLHSTSCNDCTNNCLKPIHRNVHTNTAMLFYAFVRSNSKSLCAENLLCRHHGEQIEKWLLPPHSHGFFNNKPMYLYVRMAYFRSTIRNRLLSCVHCVCVFWLLKV